MEDMEQSQRTLNGKGEFDYDYAYDILFFKIKDREYVRSLEFDNIVLDVDAEQFIVGIQIFEASSFLNIPKEALRTVRKWQFWAQAEEGRLEVRLAFEVALRNRIIEPRPILIRQIDEDFNPSVAVCEPAAPRAAGEV